jgi:hypothetical protein
MEYLHEDQGKNEDMNHLKTVKPYVEHLFTPVP